MKFTDRMKKIDELYPSDIIDAWTKSKHRPWYQRLGDAIKNFIDTLTGEIESD